MIDNLLMVRLPAMDVFSSPLMRSYAATNHSVWASPSTNPKPTAFGLLHTSPESHRRCRDLIHPVDLVALTVDYFFTSIVLASACLRSISFTTSHKSVSTPNSPFLLRSNTK